jgi:hypothetical protein
VRALLFASGFASSRRRLHGCFTIQAVPATRLALVKSHSDSLEERLLTPHARAPCRRPQSLPSGRERCARRRCMQETKFAPAVASPQTPSSLLESRPEGPAALRNFTVDGLRHVKPSHKPHPSVCPGLIASAGLSVSLPMSGVLFGMATVPGSWLNDCCAASQDAGRGHGRVT